MRERETAIVENNLYTFYHFPATLKVMQELNRITVTTQTLNILSKTAKVMHLERIIIFIQNQSPKIVRWADHFKEGWNRSSLAAVNQKLHFFLFSIETLMKAGMSQRKDARDSEFHIDRGRKNIYWTRKTTNLTLCVWKKWSDKYNVYNLSQIKQYSDWDRWRWLTIHH